MRRVFLPFSVAKEGKEMFDERSRVRSSLNGSKEGFHKETTFRVVKCTRKYHHHSCDREETAKYGSPFLHANNSAECRTGSGRFRTSL
jgi:hypothetical protein